MFLHSINKNGGKVKMVRTPNRFVTKYIKKNARDKVAGIMCWSGLYTSKIISRLIE